MEEKRQRQEKERKLMECLKQNYLNAFHTQKKEYPSAIGPYSLAVESEGFVYFPGQPPKGVRIIIS
jgi:hypothetical protein